MPHSSYAAATVHVMAIAPQSIIAAQVVLASSGTSPDAAKVRVPVANVCARSVAVLSSTAVWPRFLTGVAVLRAWAGTPKNRGDGVCSYP